MSTTSVTPDPSQSNTSSVTCFGRKWQLQILTAPENGSQVVWTLGQDTWLPESLRVTFDINKNGYQDLWWSEISIYNLNLATQEAVIQQGYEVILSAGYQTGANFGVIFQGRVFQVTWTREDVVDYKLTLHCMTGLAELVDNMVSYSAQQGSTQQAIILNMLESAQTKIDVQKLNSNVLGTKVLPRGEIVFGSAYKYLSEVANGNGLQLWSSQNGITLDDITPQTGTPQYTYSAVPDPSSPATQHNGVSYTIIGTPQQIPEGVMFRVLMDSRLDITAPALSVKIDNAVIRQMQVQPPNLPPILASDGVYAVGCVRHRGDTRGDDWYTDVLGYTSVAGKLGVLGEAASLR